MAESPQQREQVDAEPFVKWAGGKRQVIPDLDKLGLLLPDSDYDTFHEPFVGGGAVFFHLGPDTAVINDSNPDLMNAYRVIRDSVDELVELLKEHERNHNDVSEDEREQYYYSVREWDRDPETWNRLSGVEKAARFIYLNRTCYNGLYRVNSDGQFNVPIGRYKNPTVCHEDPLRAVHHVLKDVEVHCKDFRDTEIIDAVGEEDFVYCDPPYDPLSDTANFTSYTSGGFGDEDQEDLADACATWAARGAKVLVSNSDTEFIRGLYEERGFEMDVVEIPRAISSKGDDRGAVPELAIYNYEPVQERL